MADRAPVAIPCRFMQIHFSDTSVGPNADDEPPDFATDKPLFVSIEDRAVPN
jgi:hypothetical protein